MSESIPGFTEEQSWAIERVLERAVSKGVAAGIAAYQRGNCDEHRDHTERLETAVFGRTEEGVVGLDQRMALVEKALGALSDSALWFKRTAAGALIVGGCGFAVWVIEALLRR